ncbi:hypothetical protein Tsubulata_019440 [Turnera subulata]|uniref:rRNA adenine N(6)-methyltransferase n=1 Tax=Turnera subulata TaxID=218843 RepID=A0A9Q0J1T7_9ROSI|nr:hypothetical protein Tsubulata_019440 [Turnera subulata]
MMNTLLKNQVLSHNNTSRPLPFKFVELLFPRILVQQLRTNTLHDKHETKDRQPDNFFRLHKSKGQHLLTNPRVLDTIVRKSAINPTDTVLEIGPGTGNLTLRLLQAASKVVAVEIDERMVKFLQERASEQGLQHKLSVTREDALKAEFPRFDLVVANIPYGISSPLVTKLVYGEGYNFRSATLLLQKEFARRLLAKPGDSEFNRLAVNVKLVAEVEFVMDVSKRDFVPCPKVDSSVVIIRPKSENEIPSVNLDEWRAFTRSCFNKKNKTLGATFKQKKRVMELLNLSQMRESEGECRRGSNDGYDFVKDDNLDDQSDDEDCIAYSYSETELTMFKRKIIEVLKTSGFEDKRPSKLSIEDLLNLLSLLNGAGIYFHDLKGAENADNNTVLNRKDME